MGSAYIQGFFIGAGLIIAIGAQNAYVIRQGIKGRHVLLVTTICFLSDALLISLGVAGVGTLIAENALISDIAAWGGAVFLIVYGGMAAKSCIQGTLMNWQEPENGRIHGWKVAVLTTLGFTFLNPHVYLDTLVLVGGIAAQFAASERMYFAFGAISSSAIWFYSLGFGAVALAPFFRKPLGARLLDGLVAVLMWVVAAFLITGQLTS